MSDGLLLQKIKKPREDRDLEYIESSAKDLVSGEFLDIIRSIMAPLVRDWVSRHQHIDIKIMMVYLTTAIV